MDSGFNNNTKGHLVLIGGSEDKRGGMRVLSGVVEVSNAISVVVIPCASSVPERRLSDYRKAFEKIGVTEIIDMDVRSPSEADRPDNLDAVDRADLIFFTGGDQVRLVDLLAGSTLLERIRARFAAGGTIAGTSAGAAAASDPMIYDGDGRGFRKGSVRHGPGFGFLPGITVDTHFVSRGRISRLAQFLSSGNGHRGIGLGEDTAVFIAPDGIAEVRGRGMVTTLNAEQMDVSSYHESEHGGQLTMDGLRLGFLAPGTLFDLAAWRVVDRSTHPTAAQRPRRGDLQKEARR